MTHQQKIAKEVLEGNSVEQEGGYYYDLFKFFSNNHNLILVDSEIQDIIHAVEKFNNHPVRRIINDTWDDRKEVCPHCSGAEAGIQASQQPAIQPSLKPNFKEVFNNWITDKPLKSACVYALEMMYDKGYEAASKAEPKPSLSWVKASERLPVVGVYNAKYNGDHIIFQVHDGGFRVVFYDGSIIDNPKLSLVKWLDESPIKKEYSVQLAERYAENETYWPKIGDKVLIEQTEGLKGYFVYGEVTQIGPPDDYPVIEIDGKGVDLVSEGHSSIIHPVIEFNTVDIIGHKELESAAQDVQAELDAANELLLTILGETESEYADKLKLNSIKKLITDFLEASYSLKTKLTDTEEDLKAQLAASKAEPKPSLEQTFEQKELAYLREGNSIYQRVIKQQREDIVKLKSIITKLEEQPSLSEGAWNNIESFIRDCLYENNPNPKRIAQGIRFKLDSIARASKKPSLSEEEAEDAIVAMLEAKEQFYTYGQSLGIKLNDLQSLMLLAKKAIKEDDVPSHSNTDVTSVASHSSTVGNSIEQVKYEELKIEAAIMRKALIDIANWDEKTSPYFTMCDTPIHRANEAIALTDECDDAPLNCNNSIEGCNIGIIETSYGVTIAECIKCGHRQKIEGVMDLSKWEGKCGGKTYNQ